MIVAWRNGFIFECVLFLINY